MPQDRDMTRLEEKVDSALALSTEMNVSVQLLVQAANEEKLVSRESRAETKREIKDLTKRMRDVELYQEGNKETFSDFKVIKVSIIRWVVGSVLAFASVATVAVTFITKING